MNISKNNTRPVYYTEFMIGKYINQYYPPLIIIVGTIGNVLAVIIYGKKTLKNKPMSLLMRSLALVDSLVLLLVLFTYWIVTNFTLETTSVEVSRRMCVGFTYILYVSANWSHYLLVAITLYRMIAVMYPFKRSSQRNVKYCIISIGIVSLVKNLHWII